MVSIIVPNYNHSKYLSERIESILNQTYHDFELILLDDCSTDNSKKVIDRYRNKPYISHIILNEINSGSTFKQWEKGISLAKGDYIWIAESDDVAEPDFLETITNALKNTPKARIAFTNSYIIDSESKITDKDLDTDTRENQIIVEKSVSFAKSKMLFSNRIYNASAVVFEKNLWYEITKDFTRLRLCGDWICWLSMLLKSESIIHISKKLNHFRIHNNKVTTTSVNNGTAFIERLEVIKYILQNYKISSFLKNAIIGRGLWLIHQSSLKQNTKQEIRALWDTFYPNRSLAYVCFLIHKALTRFS
jgi:Glycosyltransferases involved in cell wall biogenesis